jgi:hypothetical protein
MPAGFTCSTSLLMKPALPLPLIPCLPRTVREQKAMFTQRDVKQADAARRLYRILRRPNSDEYLKHLANGSLLNCPTTADDDKRATTIYGPDVTTLKGKTTRSGDATRVPVYGPVRKCGRKPEEALLAEFAVGGSQCLRTIGPIQAHESTEEGHTQGHKSDQNKHCGRRKGALLPTSTINQRQLRQPWPQIPSWC